jgi:hypothetical protein
MVVIRFKSRSLIRRFGSKPVRVSEALAKHYTDRNQAISIKKEAVIEEEVQNIEEVIPYESPPEGNEEVTDEGEEEKIEIKIRKPKK